MSPCVNVSVVVWMGLSAALSLRVFTTISRLHSANFAIALFEFNCASTTIGLVQACGISTSHVRLDDNCSSYAFSRFCVIIIPISEFFATRRYWVWFVNFADLLDRKSLFSPS